MGFFQIPEDVLEIFPEHYHGVNLALWIIFTVELFVFGTIFFIRAQKAKEIEAKRKIELGHSGFAIFYGVCRIFFILMMFINDGADYDLYCAIAYFWGILGFTSLNFVLEKYALERKPYLSSIGIVGVCISLLGMYGEIREYVLLVILAVSLIMMFVLWIIYLFLMKNTSGKLRKNATIGFISILLLAVAVFLDSQIILSNPNVPIIIKQYVSPILAIISIIGFYISRAEI
jgi:hypothetical protein